MPYSDNMYSSLSDDSDGEDYIIQFSPANGQFPPASSNETPRVPNVFIPDPTLLQRTERPKAQKADEESFLNSQADPSEPSFEQSSQREQAATATSQLLPHHHREVTPSQSSASHAPWQASSSRHRSSSLYSEAPPAYTPSPVSPISPIPHGSTHQQNRPSNYNTFGTSRMMGTSGVESESLLGQQPESMSAPVDEENGTPAWARRVRRRMPAWLKWKNGLLALAILIASIVLLGGISFASSRPTQGNGSTPQPAEPVEKEPEAQEPDDSGSPELPIEENFCQGEQHHYDDQVLDLDFVKSQNLTFIETKYRHHGSNSVRVGGYVNVRKLSNGNGSPRMELQMVTNEPDLRLFTTLDATVQEVKVTIPEAYESSVHGQRPCVEVKGTVWVPEAAEIGVLSLSTVHLPIALFDDLSLHVADYAELSSVVGDIKAAASELAAGEEGAVASNPDYTFIPAKGSWAFDSRIIEVHTTSGSIDGNWPLYDMLGLHTTSGSIQVSITPGEELEDHPKPAVLSLTTISGTISAAEPIHEPNLIPQRDYLVDVSTTSGGVHGALAFSAGITVHSTASNLALDLLPVINMDKINARNPAQLETITTSGAIAVRVLEPKFYDGNGKALTAQVLDCLDATHKSTSGNVGLRYPQSWEGSLDAKTTSGRIVARGKDLKIIKSSRGWPGSMVEARKGAEGEKSTIEARAHLGSLDILIGEQT
ncbi:hypothetical protein F5B22DRAFT_71001 [Xylaria bambusicola]|uniref:uncharacterized protein n=1 Tax=Xylaria bambusicola TaxID=326684 RepID=UPI0020087130|nr:uncharacterized protein F5B22DRAFT_71001 [Xylaria bambusicola]KAI0518561.1 hypothetical protein F5B22DRAFT_71001 [Xylaria bambusicola]